MSLFNSCNGKIIINGDNIHYYNKIKKTPINLFDIECSICLYKLINNNKNELNIKVYYNTNTQYFICNHCESLEYNKSIIIKVNILDILEFKCTYCKKIITKNLSINKDKKYLCSSCQIKTKECCQSINISSNFFNFNTVFDILYNIDKSYILIDNMGYIYLYYVNEIISDYGFNKEIRLIKTIMKQDFFEDIFIPKLSHLFIKDNIKKKCVFIKQDSFPAFIYEKLEFNNILF